MLDTYCYLCIFSGIVGPVPYGGSYEITAVCLSVCLHGMHSPLRLGGGGGGQWKVKIFRKAFVMEGGGVGGGVRNFYFGGVWGRGRGLYCWGRVNFVRLDHIIR